MSPLCLCFSLLFFSSEVKETVMAEPEKLPESSEEVRVHYSAGLTHHSPDNWTIGHIQTKRQTPFLFL